MKYFVITDSTDTQVGLRLAGVDGVVVREESAVREALRTALDDSSIGWEEKRASRYSPASRVTAAESACASSRTRSVNSEDVSHGARTRPTPSASSFVNGLESARRTERGRSVTSCW